jgi:hypothetical protein
MSPFVPSPLARACRGLMLAAAALGASAAFAQTAPIDCVADDPSPFVTTWFKDWLSDLPRGAQPNPLARGCEFVSYTAQSSSGKLRAGSIRPGLNGLTVDRPTAALRFDVTGGEVNAYALQFYGIDAAGEFQPNSRFEIRAYDLSGTEIYRKRFTSNDPFFEVSTQFAALISAVEIRTVAPQSGAPRPLPVVDTVSFYRQITILP